MDSNASQAHFPPQSPSVSESSQRRSRIKKWHGHERTASLWGGLRKDDDLWHDDGDCLVFLHTSSTSERGPCFKIPWSLLKDACCLPLLRYSSPPNSASEQDESQLTHSSAALSSGDTEDVSRPETEQSNVIEIHLMTPNGLSSRDALQYHITTRNFFAWLCQKPLVGDSLGQSLSELLDRMKLYRSPHVENVEDVLIYADDLGYSQVECCADHALAMLCFAERHRISLVWNDAFAHCVGMSDELSTSPEFEYVSRVTKALITRASLEMDMHITRTSRSLTDYLLDELSDAGFGLAPDARAHLDNFRAFLLTYHIDKYGYWPPSADSTFPYHVFSAMNADFQSLYEFLADYSSDGSHTSAALDGGVSLEHVLHTFNKRHGHPALPHALPLLPKQAGSARASTTKSLRQLALQRSSQRSSMASMEGMDLSKPESWDEGKERGSGASPLVQRYRQFESRVGFLNDGISATEACKVRWILIYCLLQTLRSVVCAAEGVRECKAPYPLCVLTSGLPPWRDDEEVSTEKGEASLMELASVSSGAESFHTAFTSNNDSDEDGSAQSEDRAMAKRRSSSISSPLRPASDGASSMRSVADLVSARRHSVSKKRRSQGSRGSVSSVNSDATVTNGSSEPKRPPSLPRGLFELGEMNEALRALDKDAVEIDQLVPPPGADEEVFAQALARYAAEVKGRNASTGTFEAVHAAMLDRLRADTPPEQRSPTLDASHLAFEDDSWEALSLHDEQLKHTEFKPVKLDAAGPEEQQPSQAQESGNAVFADGAPTTPSTSAHEPVEAYQGSRYDVLHLDSAPIGSDTYESSDEVPSPEWSSNTEGSLGYRDSKEFDSASLPSLDPATPSPGVSRKMSLSRSKRHSSSLFSSLRSSRSFSSIYKSAEYRTTKQSRLAGSGKGLSQATAYTNEASPGETKIARQWSWANQQSKVAGDAWMADE